MRPAIALSSLLMLAGCGDAPESETPPPEPLRGAATLCTGAEAQPYPAPGDWPANRGPGAPQASFTADELLSHCAYLDGGEADVTDHHNLLTMYEGYLLMPYAPEWGGGGLTLWDISEPCNPVVVGGGTSEFMRETHAIGFSSLGGRWAVVDYIGGIDEGGAEFWDVSDPAAPRPVSTIATDNFFYPDAYARVTLSVFWQVPYVFAGGADNGVFVIDATDPTDPFVVHQVVFDPVMRVGQVQAVGNLLIVTEAEGARTVLLDISDPTSPQPVGGGDFRITDGDGVTREAYFSNVAHGYVWYARKDDGGGVIAYDIRDPHRPRFAGDISSDGNGGYVFLKDDHAFVGEGRFAAVYDVSDVGAIREVARLSLQGDLDTITPIANLVVLSVDDEANDDQGSAIAPFEAEPDTAPPHVTWAYPPDGATLLPPGSRFGVTFSEPVDVKSAWEGSVRLYRTHHGPDAGRVDAVVSAQENIVNLVPTCPLEPGAYTLEIPEGGIVDFAGNAVADSFVARFEVGG